MAHWQPGASLPVVLVVEDSRTGTERGLIGTRVYPLTRPRPVALANDRNGPGFNFGAGCSLTTKDGRVRPVTVTIGFF